MKFQFEQSVRVLVTLTVRDAKSAERAIKRLADEISYEAELLEAVCAIPGVRGYDITVEAKPFENITLRGEGSR